MELPKLDLSVLPDLDTATGMFGSLAQATPGSDDRIVMIMVYVYETVPPEAILI